ncbi:MAG: TRAP transporter large permease [Chloroflexi bacterium]|nr:TRAP transporter large permease [Chloroflexota bacterium]
MDPQLLSLIGIGGFVTVIVLGLIGFPIAFSTAIIGLFGMAYLRGWEAATGFSGAIPYEATTSYELSVLPLFVFMGYLAFQMGATSEFYWACRQWLGRIRGGLAMATVMGCAAFAACTGSGSATAAVFGKMAYPEMKKYGYDRNLSLGAVACSAPLAIMIPPSAALVIYGVMAETNISQQLLAGFLPGLLTATLFMAMISFRAWRNPNVAPAVAGVTWPERISSLKGVWPIMTVILTVVGGLYFGIFTPTEAGAFGVFAAFAIGMVRRSLSWKGFKSAIIDATRTNCMLFTIIAGIFLFLRFLAITRLPFTIGDWITGLEIPGLAIIGMILLLGMVLGMFMDVLGILLLVVPIALPAVRALGYDPIWFGVLLVHVCEMGLVTPPVGLVSFALKGVLPEVPLESIFRSIIPYEMMMVVTLAVLLVFPQITLLLPNLMSG